MDIQYNVPLSMNDAREIYQPLKTGNAGGCHSVGFSEEGVNRTKQYDICYETLYNSVHHCHMFPT